ncbi:MAG TPA: hypothetical protein VFC24_13920, partial [Casimicrobiaceae bacterium]|nr:hypothetical protein [Casimicrobiaceae bacterium]
RQVTAEQQELFIERFLHARGIEVNDATRSVVGRAIAQFPGGLPAPRIDLERFIDFAAGPRLRRLRGQASRRDRSI